MDPRYIGANVQAFHANGNGRRKPMTESEEDSYYGRHATSADRALRLISVCGSLWRRFASTAAIEAGAAKDRDRPAALGHSSHA